MGLGLQPRMRRTLGVSWDTLGMTERAPGATDMFKDNTEFGLAMNFNHVLILVRGSGSQKQADELYLRISY